MTSVKLAEIVALAVNVTVVVALFAFANVAVPLVTVQLLNTHPLAAVVDMLVAVLAVTVLGVVYAVPATVSALAAALFGLRTTVSVC